MEKNIPAGGLKRNGRPTKKGVAVGEPLPADQRRNTLDHLIGRKTKYDNMKTENVKVAEVMAERSEFAGRANRLNGCAMVLGFDCVEKDSGEFAMELKKAIFCKDKFCPHCNYRRSLKLRALFTEKIDEIQTRNNSKNWLFLTLTLKTCEAAELRSQIDLYNQAWQRLSQRKFFKDAILGWVKSVEITRGKGGKAHAHLHILLYGNSQYFAAKYIKQEDWKRHWAECARIDYEPQVDIRRVKAKKGGGDAEEALRDALIETIKYSVKSMDLLGDKGFFFEVLRQTKGLRFVAAGGVLKSIFVEDGDEAAAEGEPADAPEKEPDVWVKYFRNFRRYLRIPEVDKGFMSKRGVYDLPPMDPAKIERLIRWRDALNNPEREEAIKKSAAWFRRSGFGGLVYRSFAAVGDLLEEAKIEQNRIAEHLEAIALFGEPEVPATH